MKGNQAILVCLGCETDFVAATPDFKFLAETIATEAISEFPASLEELKAQKTASGYTLEEDITNQAGKTGEKHVLAYYAGLEAPFVTEYVHFNGKLGAIVAFNKEIPASIARGIAMQVASMNPVAVDEASVPAEVLESEKTVAIQKTKDEQIQKAVDAALKKAGINPAHVDSEDHIESNTAKGWRQRREGCESPRPDDREHRQGPRRQVPEGEHPPGAGVPAQRQQGDRQGRPRRR